MWGCGAKGSHTLATLALLVCHARGWASRDTEHQLSPCPALRNAVNDTREALGHLSAIIFKNHSINFNQIVNIVPISEDELSQTLLKTSNHWVKKLRRHIAHALKECKQHTFFGHGSATHRQRRKLSGNVAKSVNLVLRVGLMRLAAMREVAEELDKGIVRVLMRAARLMATRGRTKGTKGPRASLEVDMEVPLRQVPDTFLSVALGASLIQHRWENFNTSSEKLLTLTRALSPAILRVGGSASNYLTYDPSREAKEDRLWEQKEDNRQNGRSEKDKWKLSEAKKENIYKDEDYNTSLVGRSEILDSLEGHVFSNFTMTYNDWIKLQSFARDVNMTLLFDLNQFQRRSHKGDKGRRGHKVGSWDASNAKLIFKDTLPDTRVIWQLGNEPNSYSHHFGYSIPARQMALDYLKLWKVLGGAGTLVGPDVTRPTDPQTKALRGNTGVMTPSLDYLTDFLRDVGPGLAAITWHQYYVDGRDTRLEEFMSAEVLQRLVWQARAVSRLRDNMAPTTPIWLTETGSAWGGGAAGLSNSFVGGFLWLDKLGVSGREGVDVVARQTLYGGRYALLDQDGDPYPDYWLSVLYKREVGGRVLDLTLHDAPPTTRLYAHCHNPRGINYTPGGVVIYGMNLGGAASTVRLRGPLSTAPLSHYLLQPPQAQLQARSVLLNGELVEMASPSALPDLLPVSVPSGSLHLPPASLALWVAPHAQAPACM